MFNGEKTKKNHNSNCGKKKVVKTTLLKKNPHFYGATTPKRLKIALPVIKKKRLCYSDQELSEP